MRKIVALGAYDSHVKWAVAAAESLRRTGDRIEVMFLDPHREGESIDETFPREFVQRFNRFPNQKIRFDDLLESAEIEDADVIVGILFYPSLNRLLARLNQLVQKPYIVIGFAGLLLTRGHGIVNRLGADAIVLPSKSDKLFSETYIACRADNTAPKCFATGIPDFFGSRPLNRDSNRIVFATQLQMPSLSGREYIACRLIEWAEGQPNLQIVIKERLLPGMATVHREDAPYRNLILRIKPQLPPNIIVSDAPFEDELADARLVVTMSSTAGVEALLAGVPAAFIGDFGWLEEYGLHKFTKSGCITTFDRLIEGQIPEVNPEWLANYRRSPEEWAALNADIDDYFDSDRRFAVRNRILADILIDGRKKRKKRRFNKKRPFWHLGIKRAIRAYLAKR